MILGLDPLFTDGVDLGDFGFVLLKVVTRPVLASLGPTPSRLESFRFGAHTDDKFWHRHSDTHGFRLPAWGDVISQ